jgi:hypothetical protein
MLKRPSPFAPGRRLASAAGRLALAALGWSLLTARTFAEGATTQLVPILAQATKTTAADPAADAGSGGSWLVLDWLIVVVLIGAALFAICRSSRRN